MMETTDDTNCMPMIFQTSNLSYEERYNVYWNLIFGNCKPRDVNNKLAAYMERFVHKSGWKAIWRYANTIQLELGNNKNNVDILVEVVDVECQNLTADVNVSKPLTTDSHVTLQEVHKLLSSKDYQVPITELLPVHDDSGDFDETAIALEHVRFFFDNLWREWDKEDDGEYMYAARNIENRLRLYYDILEENYSKEFIQMYTDMCDCHKQAVLDFMKLRKDMSASDSEQELDTSDVLRLAQKTNELENIERRLKTMENPQMRYLIASDSAVKGISSKSNRDYPVTMIVARQLLANMCKMLPDDTVIEHYTIPQRAISCCQENDKIVIHSGIYSLNEEAGRGSLNFTESVAITCVGETTIECDKQEDVSVKIQSPQLQIDNIKFVQSVNSSLVVVEKGKTVFRNCEFHCVSSGISVKQGAELVMWNCKIIGALGAGLSIEENTVVHLEGCEICQNGRNGNAGGIKIIYNASRPAHVLVNDCTIQENYGYGISIVNNNETINGETEAQNGVHLSLHNNIEYGTRES